MKFVIKFLGLIVVICLATASLTYVLDNTLTNAKFLHAQANQSGLYDNLARDIPSLLSGGTGAEATKTALGLAVTPNFVEDHIDPWFNQIEAYYQHNGPVPQLELKDLSDQAQIYGVKLSNPDGLTQPIKFQDPGLKPILDLLHQFWLASLILAAACLLLIGVLTKGWQRFVAPAKTLIAAGIVVAVGAAIAQIVPGLLNSAVGQVEQLKVAAPDFLPFAKAVAGGVTNEFLRLVAGLGIAAGALILLGLLSKLAGKFGRHGGSEMRPKPDNRLNLH